MNDYSVDVVVEFGRSGKRVSVDVPLRQLFYLDRHSVREVEPDGSVIYRLPGHWGREEMKRNRLVDCGCPA